MMKLIKIVAILMFIGFIPIFGQSQILSRNLKTDFGAKGDGKTDDSEAWARALDYFSTLSKSEQNKKKELIIPKGTYRIGRQGKNPKMDRSLILSPVLKNVSNITIKGELSASGQLMSKFKYLDNLYYGVFEPNGTSSKSFNQKKVSELGYTLRVDNSCDNVTIKDLEMDGNLQKLRLGFTTKLNLIHIGLYLNFASNVTVDNVYAHHFALDGFYVKTNYSRNADEVILNNVRSEYNGRQGLSFTSGSGLKVTNSKFAYTGRGGLLLSPGANVDIENHAGQGKYLENILFENCVLEDNAGGSGSLNLAGQIRNFKMKNCQIITSNWMAIQSNFSKSKDFTFENCIITGTIEFEYGGNVKTDKSITRFINCKISDNQNQRTVGLNRALICITDNVVFENCEFFVWSKRKLFLSNSHGKATNNSNAIKINKASFFDLHTKRKMDFGGISKNTATENRIQIK